VPALNFTQGVQAVSLAPNSTTTSVGSELQSAAADFGYQTTFSGDVVIHGPVNFGDVQVSSSGAYLLPNASITYRELNLTPGDVQCESTQEIRGFDANFRAQCVSNPVFSGPGAGIELEKDDGYDDIVRLAPGTAGTALEADWGAIRLHHADSAGVRFTSTGVTIGSATDLTNLSLAGALRVGGEVRFADGPLECRQAVADFPVTRATQSFAHDCATDEKVLDASAVLMTLAGSGCDGNPVSLGRYNVSNAILTCTPNGSNAGCTLRSNMTSTTTPSIANRCVRVTAQCCKS
jgi:hypothetical protein